MDFSRLSLDERRELLGAPDDSTLIGLRDRLLLHLLMVDKLELGEIVLLAPDCVFELDIEETPTVLWTGFRPVRPSQTTERLLSQWVEQAGIGETAPLISTMRHGRPGRRALTYRSIRRRVLALADDLELGDRLRSRSLSELDDDDSEKLLGVVDLDTRIGIRDFAMMSLMIRECACIRDICELRVDAIDGQYIWMWSGGVRLSAETARALDRWTTLEGTTEGYLFVSVVGGEPLTEGGIRSRLRSYLRRARIEAVEIRYMGGR